MKPSASCSINLDWAQFIYNETLWRRLIRQKGQFFHPYLSWRDCSSNFGRMAAWEVDSVLIFMLILTIWLKHGLHKTLNRNSLHNKKGKIVAYCHSKSIKVWVRISPHKIGPQSVNHITFKVFSEGTYCENVKFGSDSLKIWMVTSHSERLSRFENFGAWRDQILF